MIGLTPKQKEYLEIIKNNPGITSTGLRDKVSKHRSGFSGMSARAGVMKVVRALEEKGFVLIRYGGGDKQLFVRETHKN